MKYLFWIVAAGVIVADQWTKNLVRHTLVPETSVTILRDVIYLTRLQNPGVAFGQLANGGPLLIVVAAAAAMSIVLYRARLMGRGEQLHPLLALGLALPLGGALGNLIDRVTFGKVMDFIDVRFFTVYQWPVFNVADSAITIGAISLVAYFLLISQPDTAGGHPAVAKRERGSEP